MVKVIEFGYHELVLDIDDLHSRDLGNVIESSPFVVGGYSFTILFYPGGARYYPHDFRDTSLFIKNHSPKPAHLVYHVHSDPHYSEAFDSFSSRDRETYHELVVVEPGCHFGRMYFRRWNSLFNTFLRDKDLRIRATIGVVLDHPPPIRPPSFETWILFRVGAEARVLHYVQESIVKRLCPSLLLDHDALSDSNYVVDISDIEPHVFKAVLWFVINKKLHEKDRKLIASNKDFFATKMLAAAARFNLKDLREQCESFMSHGDSQV